MTTHTHKQLKQFLSVLRQAHPLMGKIFTQGGCYQLFEIIKAVFPDAEAFYDPVIGHVYTLHGGKYYDIKG